MWHNYSAHAKFDRPAASLSGEPGKKFIDHVWHDILDALRKDVPEVLSLVHS
jgi:hypothetical protein